MRLFLRRLIRDQVAVWDVVNEPLGLNSPTLNNDIFARTLGEVYIDEAFRLVRELDPDAELFLNEFFFFYSRDKALGFVEQAIRTTPDAGPDGD